MRLALSCAALLILALPGLGFAQDAPPGTVRVASRLFLAPDLPERYAEDEDFLPLTEMGWVQAIVEADPLLGPQGTVLHVTRLPSPPAWLFGEDGTPATLGNRDGVPEALRFEGLDAQTALGIPNPQTFNYRPEGAEPGFMLTCADPDPATGAFEFCGLLATYPPDPAISLKARFYHPEPFGALAPAVADRLRAIALCLDVTDAPPAYSEAALAALLAASPRLEGCEGAPTS